MLTFKHAPILEEYKTQAENSQWQFLAHTLAVVMLSLGLCIKAFLWLSLFAFTSYNALKSVEKFRERKVSTSSRKEQLQFLEFPSVTICSLFSDPQMNLFRVAESLARKGKGEKVFTMEDIEGMTNHVRQLSQLEDNCRF